MDRRPAGEQNTAPATARLAEEPGVPEWFQERRREVIVLIMRFLMDHGYGKTYETLCQETQLSLGQVSTADNIDLIGIVQEYILYFRGKFGKSPILIRQVQPPPAPHHPEVRPEVRPLPASADPASRAPTAMRDLRPPAASAPRPPGGVLLPQSARLAANGRVVLPPVAVEPTPAPAASVELTTPSTFLIGSVQPCTQEQLIATVDQALAGPPGDLTTVLSFYRPKKARLTPSKRPASNHLELSDFQEELLYALVGCDGVGWSIRNVRGATRAWLQSRHRIDKELLQLFYKNRAPKRRKEDGCPAPVP